MVLLVVGVLAAPRPATAAGDSYETVPVRRLLNALAVKPEHRSGYDREKFTHWTDADDDGCDTRDEVLIREAVKQPRVSQPYCTLSDGRWVSAFDGTTTTNPSTFDVDHFVPLAEAWDSGARRWTYRTRRRFANDLRYGPSLIAVSASSNRSKGDSEPQDWMPPRTAHHCTYLARWVAVKWRWRLAVDVGESAFVARELAACGWPDVRRPTRGAVHVR